MEHYPIIIMSVLLPHRNNRPGWETTGKEKAYLAMKDTQGIVDGMAW
jgi:hypothetical protein